MMMIQNSITSVIMEAKSVVILPHVSADGDALGSSFALALALKKLGKEVKVYLEEGIPFTYDFLPGKETSEVYGGSGAAFDVAVALDTGDLQRLGKRIDIFNKAGNTVNIDHHQTNTGFAGYNFVNPVSSAVGEIIWQLIKTMGLSLDLEVSICLYVAIATDTGGFRYSNTTAVTHQIAAELINNGIDTAKISQKVFESTSLGKVRLMGAAINTLELMENGKLAIITLNENMFVEAGAKEEDCDGIVNIGRNIIGVEIAVMLRQQKTDEIRVNLRSQSYVDVAAIAVKFGGGGHKRAAGCTIKGSFDDVKGRILDEIKEVLE